MTNEIGLEAGKEKALAQGLNQLLATYQLFYMNTRGFHWNIAGEKFFELHVKFEELYNDAVLKIDEIAERILTIGSTPMHSYTEYLQHSRIKEVTNVSDGRTAMQTLLDGFRMLIAAERDIMVLANDANDEGTYSLMSDYVREQEKSVWMYAAWLR